MITYKELLEYNKKQISKLIKEHKLKDFNETKTHLNSMNLSIPNNFAELCFVYQSNLNLAFKTVNNAEDLITAMQVILKNTLKDEVLKAARKLF